MKNFNFYIALFIGSAILLSACKKSDPDAVIQHILKIQSIVGANNTIDPNRRGFLNLYDGQLYNQAEAKQNSSKIDFAYHYGLVEAQRYRLFWGIKDMSTRSVYTQGFSTITISHITAAKNITKTEFDNIRFGSEIVLLISGKNLDLYDTTGIIADPGTDVLNATIFAFSDKNGKKGLLMIDDYVTNPPLGDEAGLTIRIKVQR